MTFRLIQDQLPGAEFDACCIKKGKASDAWSAQRHHSLLAAVMPRVKWIIWFKSRFPNKRSFGLSVLHLLREIDVFNWNGSDGQNGYFWDSRACLAWSTNWNLKVCTMCDMQQSRNWDGSEFMVEIPGNPALTRWRRKAIVPTLVSNVR